MNVAWVDVKPSYPEADARTTPHTAAKHSARNGPTTNNGPSNTDSRKKMMTKYKPSFHD